MIPVQKFLFCSVKKFESRGGKRKERIRVSQPLTPRPRAASFLHSHRLDDQRRAGGRRRVRDGGRRRQYLVLSFCGVAAPEERIDIDVTGLSLFVYGSSRYDVRIGEGRGQGKAVVVRKVA